jgi:hypothetical protein
MGMLWMVPAGWLNHLPRAAQRALKALQECHVGHGMRKFTLLAGLGGGCRDGSARRRGDDVKGGGKTRRVAKQFEIAGNGRQPQLSQRLAWRLLSAKPVLTSRESASFLRQSPVVNHLSLTCSATCQPLVILVLARKTRCKSLITKGLCADLRTENRPGSLCRALAKTLFSGLISQYVRTPLGAHVAVQCGRNVSQAVAVSRNNASSLSSPP